MGGGGSGTAEADRAARQPVVDESTTFATVRSLNALSLSQFRCHSVRDDAAPSVDPFALVQDEISALNNDVCDEVVGEDEVLTCASQHFFGAGNTRAGKRVRPVIVCLMGQATAMAMAAQRGGGDATPSSSNSSSSSRARGRRRSTGSSRRSRR